MNPPPDLELTVDCLCSKWGFNDGDLPEQLWDYWDEVGVAIDGLDWHGVLRRLVRTHLVPALEAAGHTVEVYDIDTIHNPIRAQTIDGEEVNDHGGGCPVAVRVESVTVPYAAIAEACRLPSPDARATGA